MSALDFDLAGSIVPDDFVWSRIDSRIILARPRKTDAIFLHQRVHVICYFDLSHADFDEVKRFLIDFFGDLNGSLNAGEFGVRFSSAHGIDDRFCADEPIHIGCAAQIFDQELVHGMSQTVSVDIVLGRVNRYPVGVEAVDRLAQDDAHGGVISDDFAEDIHPFEGFFFKIAGDGDLVAFFCEDERGWPGQVVIADEKIEHWVAYAAGFADKGEPEVDVLLFENLNGLVDFLLNEGHENSLMVRTMVCFRWLCVFAGL